MASGTVVELPTRMRGISSSDKYLKADLFALLAQTEVNVIRLGFSVDSTNPSPPTPQNPLAPYAANLAVLDKALPLARAAGIKIILCAAETYGWSPSVFQGTASEIAVYRSHLATFWTAMAQRYLNETAIVAYDILNEPKTDWPTRGVWYADVMPAAVAAIRSVNTNVWLVVESEYQGAAGGFSTMPILDDPHVIYSFHFHSPHSYCSQGILGYPGYTASHPGLNSMWGTAPYTFWDRETLRNEMLEVIRFKTTYPDKRILVGEFGVLRWAPGAGQWLADCIALFEQYGWDWCNHSPSGWNGYNATYSPTVQTGSNAPDRGDRGARWSVLGPNISGNSISSVFHADGAPFYQLVETLSAIPGDQSILPATAAPGLEISWQTEVGSNYQVESSSDLDAYPDLGPIIIGDGSRAMRYEPRTAPARFYRVRKSKSP